jgi:hypothetical protein
VLAVALGALVATDAGDASELAWLAAGVAGALVALGSASRSSTPVHASLALLGATLLLRQDARLVLAPLYGAGLLLVDELASRSIELAGVAAIGPAVIWAREAAAIALVASGACAAACVALAVNAAPGRSVAFTAVGSLVVVIVFAVIAWHSRRKFRATTGAEPDRR